MSETRTVLRETTVGALASATAVAISFLMVPVTTRALGVDQWGLLAAALAWASLFATVFHLSLNQVAVHLLGRWGPTARPVVFGSVLALSAVSSAVAVATGLALWMATGGAAYRGVPLGLLAAALVPIPFTIWTTASQGLFQAGDRVVAYSLASVGTAVVSACATLVLVVGFGLGVFGVLASYTLGGGAFAVLSIALLRRWTGRARIDAGTMRGLLRGSATLHWAAIGYFVFASSDLLVLNQFSPPAEVAWYRLASFLVGGVLLVPSAMASSFFALGGRLGADAAWPIQRRIIWKVLGATALGGIVAYPFVPWGVGLIAGPGFAPAAGILRILLLALPGLMASALFAPQWILRGMFWRATLLTVATGALNLAANLWAVPRWGATGAAWAKVGCTLLALAVNVVAAALLFRPQGKPEDS